jgi:phosphopantetheinyl transferase
VTELASRFFHPSECKALDLLPEHRKRAAFLELWLKKEAVAKLTRKGLLYSLPVNLDKLESIQFEEPALLPLGKRAVLAFYKK